MRVGPNHQASLPALMPKPLCGAQPNAEEASWLQNKVHGTGAFADLPLCAPVISLAPNLTGERYIAIMSFIAAYTPSQMTCLYFASSESALLVLYILTGQES